MIVLHVSLDSDITGVRLLGLRANFCWALLRSGRPFTSRPSITFLLSSTGASL
jgi:hypothetical protein